MVRDSRRRFPFSKVFHGSPLKDAPLRNPGQSLDEALERLTVDELLTYVLFPGFFWILALFEWVARSTGMPRRLELYAIVAVALTSWSRDTP